MKSVFQKKKKQSLKVDLPTVGPNTLKLMYKKFMDCKIEKV